MHVHCQCPACCAERWLNHSWLGQLLGLLALLALGLAPLCFR